MSEEVHWSEPTSESATLQQRTGGSKPAAPEVSPNDLDLVAQLRKGDEAAFLLLIERHHSALLRLATIYVGAQMVAEEVVQETWMAILEGLNRFEGRSSLKTWMFRILTNCAKTRAQREGRSLPFSSFPDVDTDSSEPAVDPDRFLPETHRWVSCPANWRDLPEERLLSQETQACLERAIAGLPPSQRAIITLRDIEGWTAGETCQSLGISEGNQRVLLHRARSKVRAALEKYFEEG